MQTVTLSVKNVPRNVAARLKDRAARNHRSLQGELLAMLTDAGRGVTMADLRSLADRLDLRTPSSRPGWFARIAMAVVVDASALGAIAFGEPEGSTLAAHLE